jgi:hypothetical protein
MKQQEAANHIQKALSERGICVEPGIILVGADEPWLMIESEARCVGIDPSSGIWLGMSGSRWRCVASPCSVSGVLLAVEYLLEKNERY